MKYKPDILASPSDYTVVQDKKLLSTDYETVKKGFNIFGYNEKEIEEMFLRSCCDGEYETVKFLISKNCKISISTLRACFYEIINHNELSYFHTQIFQLLCKKGAFLDNLQLVCLVKLLTKISKTLYISEYTPHASIYNTMINIILDNMNLSNLKILLDDFETYGFRSALSQEYCEEIKQIISSKIDTMTAIQNKKIFITKGKRIIYNIGEIEIEEND